jgi:hypothetical protein
MNKGSITQFLQGKTVHRAPKLVALAISCSVLVTMVALDASASPNAHAYSNARAEAAHTVLLDWRSVAVQLLETEFGKRGVRPIVGHPTATANPSNGGSGSAGGVSAPTTTTTVPVTTTTTAPPTGAPSTTPPAGGPSTTPPPSTPPPAPTTTTTAPPTTTTTAPSTPSSSGGLITAGASRNECLVASNPNNTLADLQASINKFQNATQSTVSCLGVYTDGSQAWTDWSDPWIAGGSGAAYQAWVNQAPQSRQLVVEVDLVPISLQNVNNPLSWETSCAAGDFTAYANELGTNLVKAGLENSVIRLGSEANGTWEGDFVGTTTQEQNLWASCFDNEVTGLRQAAGEHFLIDWNPNACTENIPYSNYYPGNAYVNIMGLDFYDVDCDTPSTSVSYTTLTDEVAGLSTFEAFAAAQGKPMSFPEWGLTTSPGGDDPAYIAGVGSTVNNGNFAFQEYFDTGSGASEPIDSGSTPLAAAAYQKWFGNS